MENIVKIDRSTLLKNPNAGRTSYRLRGPKSFIVKEWAEGWEREWRSAGTVEEQIDSVTGEFVLVRESLDMTKRPPPAVLGEKAVRTFVASPGAVAIESNQSIETVCNSSSSEPAYLYSYAPTLVVCPNGHQHLHTDLHEIDNDEIYAPDLCPTCDETVEMDYEDAGVVAAEIGLR